MPTPGSTLCSSSKETDIPVLQEPAADAISKDLMDELDIPILTTPVEPEEPPAQ